MISSTGKMFTDLRKIRAEGAHCTDVDWMVDLVDPYKREVEYLAFINGMQGNFLYSDLKCPSSPSECNAESQTKTLLTDLEATDAAFGCSPSADPIQTFVGMDCLQTIQTAPADIIRHRRVLAHYFTVLAHFPVLAHLKKRYLSIVTQCAGLNVLEPKNVPEPVK
jgi:hypothetical protein